MNEVFKEARQMLVMNGSLFSGTHYRNISKGLSILAKQCQFQRLAAVNGICQVRTVKDSNKISICTHSKDFIYIHKFKVTKNWRF